jgi:hypothetical protein
MRLAAGDDADVGRRAGADQFVDGIGPREMAHGIELGREAQLDGRAGRVVGAEMQPAGRCDKAFGRGELRFDGVEIDRHRALDGLGNRLEADPCPAVTRQRPAVKAELEHLGDVGRIHHGHAPGLHDEVALVRHGRRNAAMVVAGHHQHAAGRRRAVGIAVVQRIGGAIDARSLAVPQREYAAHRALRIAFHLLAAEHGGGAGLLVDRGQKMDSCRCQLLAGAPQGLVIGAQR